MNKVLDSIDTYFATNPPGWTSPHAAKIFASIVFALRPDVIVEIGVFGGRATIPIAMALRETGNGMITAIDPWSAMASSEGMTGENLEWWAKLNHEDIYQKFLKDMRDLGIQNCVKVVRKTSDEADVPSQIDCLLVDGNHGVQAIKDVARYAPSVRVGGVVYMDDLDWIGGFVKQAEANLLRVGFKQLYTVDKGGIYQRVK